MKVAVAGAGIAGTYVFRMLQDKGMEVHIFDRPSANMCRHRPCAWGFAPADEYHRLVGRFLPAGDYILQHSRSVTMDGIEMSADLLTVDKPRLVEDMLGGIRPMETIIDQSQYDRVLDATGVDRAYLGPVKGRDYVADLRQFRVSTANEGNPWIRISSAGYGWSFPLGKGEFHVGYGNLPPHFQDGEKAIEGALAEGEVICGCRSRIRMASPYHSQPFIRDNVVGVGESIGTVGPLGGDGNLYSMQCAELLVENWEDLDAYREQVLSKFSWMRKEREALERIVTGHRPTPSDVLLFVRHCRRVGFGVGPTVGLKFLTRMGPDKT